MKLARIKYPPVKDVNKPIKSHYPVCADCEYWQYCQSDRDLSEDSMACCAFVAEVY